ncbi:MAG: hypothetical protein QOI98_2185 [Solirubrobacteraceae bacterium]|jgi:hypothetical protein|nr:hypothetical protein [Solirubrobacteraceae bacterium]
MVFSVSFGSLFVLFVMVGFVSALIPAVIADRKGHNGLAYFLFGLFAWPFAVGVSLLLQDKNASGNQLAPKDRMEQIERLARLRDSGALTSEEFEAEKNRVMTS